MKNIIKMVGAVLNAKTCTHFSKYLYCQTASFLILIPNLDKYLNGESYPISNVCTFKGII